MITQPSTSPQGRRRRTRVRRVLAVSLAALSSSIALAACDPAVRLGSIGAPATLSQAPADAGLIDPTATVVAPAPAEPAQPVPATPTVVSPTPGSGTLPPPICDWQELVLNADGSINAEAYAEVARNYARPDIIDYRLGPKTCDSVAGGLGDAPPALSSGPVGRRGDIPKPEVGATDGWTGDRGVPERNEQSDWFAMSGPMVKIPGSAAQSSVELRRNGSLFCGPDGAIIDYRTSSEPDQHNYYSTPREPSFDAPATREALKNEPTQIPVTITAPRGDSVVSALVSTRSVVLQGNGNETNTFDQTWPLAAENEEGVYTTAAAMPPGGEFLILTQWNTKKLIGQLAFYAIENAVHAQNDPGGAGPLRGITREYGLSGWVHATNIRLIGKMPLPPELATPSSIAVTTDRSFLHSRTGTANFNVDFSRQDVRDRWFEGDDEYVGAAKSGVIMVASRAQDRVAFIDLQPLLTFYRNMYFTTQQRYDQTRSDQWPVTFDQAPEQIPTIAKVIGVESPTAVLAGMPRKWYFWRDNGNEGLFARSGYVFNIKGQAMRYDLGELVTTGESTEVTLVETKEGLGRNLLSAEYSSEFGAGNDIVVTSRVDIAITLLRDDLVTLGTLVDDERIVDPIGTGISRQDRSCGRATIIHVLDFSGQIVSYTVSGDGSTFKYVSTDPVSGRPLGWRLVEVI